MLPVLHGDVASAARALYRVAPKERRRLCLRLLRQAEAADRHRQCFGKLHPRYGDGSLMAAARKLALADEPGFDDVEYRRCFALVLHCLSDSSTKPAPFHLAK